MARGRIIDKSIYLDEKLANISIEARYLYKAMIIQADDEGRLRASSRYLKGLIFPFDEAIRIDTIKQWRDQIVSARLVTLYAAGGQEYLCHPNWEKWQPIRKDRAKPSDCPKPNIDGMTTNCQPNDNQPLPIPNLTKPNQTKPNPPIIPQKGDGIVIPDELLSIEGAIREWIAYKREKGQNYKPRGLQALWRGILAIDANKRKDAIEFSMANNYAGIFEKKGGKNERIAGTATYQPGKYAVQTK